MNREMRRLSEREERRKSKGQGGRGGRPGASGAGKGGPPSKSERAGLWTRLVTFLHEVRVELSRVQWPTRQQMVAFTSVTLITTTTLTLVVFAMDFVLRRSILSVIRSIIEN
jgi:preprotein translocase subunit SecE